MIASIDFLFLGCQKICNVVEKNSKSSQPCKFPFIFNGRKFTSCTDFQVHLYYLDSITEIIILSKLSNPHIIKPRLYFHSKDDKNQFWCSTKVDEDGVHVGGGNGYWGYCDKTSYTTSCKWEKPMNTLQDYMENKLGVKGRYERHVNIMAVA